MASFYVLVICIANIVKELKSKVLLLLVINTKQTGPARVDISMSNDSVEVFPVEEDLVNDSQQVRPAQISIPGQLLLEEMSRSEKNGNNITAKINALYSSSISYTVYQETDDCVYHWTIRLQQLQYCFLRNLLP